MIAALALALLAAQPAPTPAPPPGEPLPFAPPIDQPLHYRQTQHSLDDEGGDVAFTILEEVRYARDGAGYVMTIQTLSADAKAAPGAAAMFEAAMRPFVGVPVRLHLSATGDPGALIDGDAIWARIVAAVKASADAAPQSEAADRRAMLQQTAQSLASLPASQREAMMKAPAEALLGLGVPPLAVGEEAPIGAPVQTPFGVALRERGTIRRDPDRDGARHYVRDLATSADEAGRLAAALRADAAKRDAQAQQHGEDDAAALAEWRLHETGTIALSASSGLLLSSAGRVAVVDPSVPGGERPVTTSELLLVP